jgi:hypothetical protein
MQNTMPTLQDLPEVPRDEYPVEETQPQVVEQKQPIQEVAAPQETSEQRNFDALRQAKEAAEHERDTYRRQLEAQRQQQQPQPQPQKQTVLGDDDLVEGRHIKAADERYKKVANQLRQELTETRLKVQYPDFDSVVNSNTVAQLKTAYPELAATLSQSTDFYNTGVSAYTLIKKLGIYDGKDHSSNQKIVQDNSAKPRPLSSVSPQQGESALSHANAFAKGPLTPELKKKMYQEMMEARRGT